MVSSPPVKRGVPLAVCLMVGLTACQPDAPVPGAAPESAPTASPSAAPVEFVTSVRNGAENVRPDAPVTVAARSGELRTVTLTGPGRTELRGQVEGGTWKLRDVLSPAAAYTMTVTGVNAAGTPSRQVRTFRTLEPDVEATYRVTPDREVVGVGMPVMVTFDSAVATPAMRAAIEKKLSVETRPATTGSWGWVGADQVMWRPDTYWKPKTTVTVRAPLRGMQTGKDKWITKDKGAHFAISPRARVSTVDLASHEMTVRENGKVVAVYPISGGKSEGTYRTRSGTKVITEKKEFMVMDAATLGVPEDDPNYYRTEVDYAMRVTNTGEFLHSAPWSVWAQGRRNVSHGCVNMGPRAARTMFRASIVGDVVDFTGSSRRMKPGDGLSVWLYDAAQWRAKSALAAPVPPAAKAQSRSGTSAPARAASSTQAPTTGAARTTGAAPTPADATATGTISRG